MTEPRTINAPDLIRASNEWMRRFIEEPAEFQHQFQTVQDFLTDANAGREPSYGETCSAYVFTLLDEMNAAPVAG